MRTIEEAGGVSPLRDDFPIFSQKGRASLVYLDSAATSQKPAAVIEAVDEFERNCNANVHRGIYPLSEEATERYEDARSRTARFIGARLPSEVVFVRGATEALNVLALSFGTWKLKRGDEVLTTVMEHHSNIVPWQMLSWRGVVVRFVDIDESGRLDMADFESKISDRTKIVTATHASNVLGTVNPISEMAKIAHEHDAVFIVDGAQSAPHMPVDVAESGCDFFAASGHKMFAPTGIGILYGRAELLQELEPAFGGGEMISEVHQRGSKWADPPYRFEAGTPNISGAIGLGAAVDYLSSIGMENVERYNRDLVGYAMDRLLEKEDVEIYGPKDMEERSALISFNLKGIHGHDTAEILGREGVAIRSGHHCAQPLMERLGISSASRASFHIYNGKNDVDCLVDALDTVRKVFA